MNALPARRPLVTRRRALFVAIVAALLMAAAVILLIVHPWSASTTAEPPTVWQEITSGIGDGVVPKEVALEAFAYDYKVAIPGVTVPAGREGGDAPVSGTGVTRWVLANWDGLSADQQAVIDAYLPKPATANASPGRGHTSVVSLLAPAQAKAPLGVLADDQPLQDAMTADLYADLRHLGPKLGLPTIYPDLSPGPGASIVFSDTDGGNSLFTTFFEDDRGNYDPCIVTAWHNTWANQGLVGGKVSDQLHVMLTHEAVHCYQQVLWADVQTNLLIPAWISEGTAAWLAADDTGLQEPGIASWWANWFYIPEKALTERSYDAFAYFAMLSHLGRNLWSLMTPAWQAAGSASGSRSAGFIGS